MFLNEIGLLLCNVQGRKTGLREVQTLTQRTETKSWKDSIRGKLLESVSLPVPPLLHTQSCCQRPCVVRGKIIPAINSYHAPGSQDGEHARHSLCPCGIRTAETDGEQWHVAQLAAYLQLPQVQLKGRACLRVCSQLPHFSPPPWLPPWASRRCL